MENLNKKQSSLIALATNCGITVDNIEDYQNKDSVIKYRCSLNHASEDTVENILRNKFECVECLRQFDKQIVDTQPYFMALDAATQVTGVAFFNKRGQLLWHRTITMNRRDDFVKRLFLVGLEIKDLVIKNNIQCVLLEDIQLEENPVSFKKLAMLQGVLQVLIVEQLKRELITIFVNEWRAFHNIKGAKRAERKQAAINRVKNIYELDIPEDEAEAILLGKFGIHQFYQSRT